jgi:putative flavoprotein involved in K+ transport
MENLNLKQQEKLQEKISVDNNNFSGSKPERVETLIIGGGQAGLSIGYQLKRRNLRFLILDANKRVGDSWRNRWDSLRLFTPARYNGLAGMPFPASAHYFPTKDEMAEYLENYARHFNLPIRNGTNVDHLSRQGEWFVVKAGEQHFEAKHVVVAMANYQKPKIPSFAEDLDPGINHFHSIYYRNPGQLKEGDLLIVGAGNSGSEIAMDLASRHRIWMSGRDVGHIPFRIHTRTAEVLFLPFVLRLMFHRIMTINTRIGRMMREKMHSQGGSLIRVKPKDMVAAGIQMVPKVKAVKDGLPLLEDGRVLDVKNVIWCTGFHPGFSWIKLPVLGEKEPHHTRGIVAREPGLYFLGLQFLYAASSSMVQGLERDAIHIADHVAARCSQNKHRQQTAGAGIHL